MKHIKDNFILWMGQTTDLSENSRKKYAGAINTVSKDMMTLGIISKSLFEMKRSELDIVIPLILNNVDFISKNIRGDHMYSNGLKQFRSYKSMIADAEEDYKVIVDEINADTAITVTERASIIKSRIGQGEFRHALMERYNGSCIVTGINIQTLLIASHIKPWAVSNNSERLSSDNGLLLSATYDRLFDSGLISFDNSGKILVSRYVDDSNKARLKLDNKPSVNVQFSPGTKHNLEYHRDIVFLK